MGFLLDSMIGNKNIGHHIKNKSVRSTKSSLSLRGVKNMEQVCSSTNTHLLEADKNETLPLKVKSGVFGDTFKRVKRERRGRCSHFCKK